MTIGAVKIKRKDLTVVTRQLAILLSAGLPLIRSLRTLEKQSKNAAVKQILGRTAETVEGGSTFAEALAQPRNRRQALFEHGARRRGLRCDGDDSGPSRELHGEGVTHFRQGEVGHDLPVGGSDHRHRRGDRPHDLHRAELHRKSSRSCSKASRCPVSRCSSSTSAIRWCSSGGGIWQASSASSFYIR